MMAVCAFADEIDLTAELDLSKLEYGLSEEEKELIGTIGADGIYDGDAALRRILEKAADGIRDSIAEDIHRCLSLVAISVLCALCTAFGQGKQFMNYVNLTGCAAAVMLTVGGVDSLINQASDVLLRMNEYSKASLPVVYMAAAASGATVSSGAKYAVCCLALDIMLSAAQKLILPLISAYLALSICAAIYESPIVNACAGASKWLAGTLMTTLTLAFTSYISLTGVVSGSADALAVKTAKTVISTALPVVGGMISDAASTVLTAAGLIKSSAGVFALVAVCSICLLPFLSVLSKLLLFRAAAAASDIAGGLRLKALINSIGTAAAMLVGLIGSEAIILFISFTSAIKAVTV